MSIEEKRRELFEAWFKQAKPRVAQEMMDDDEFVVRWMFEAYCAALDAVVIQLPPAWKSAGSTHELMHKRDTIAAIDSTGLGLKVKL